MSLDPHANGVVCGFRSVDSARYGRTDHGGNEKGFALLGALMITTLIGTLGGALVFVVATDSMISANHRAAQQAFYAADAGIERAIGSLRTLEDWALVPGTSGVPAMDDFLDVEIAPRLGDGTIVDLARLTAEQQADTDALYAGSTNRPVWRLLAHAPLSRALTLGSASPPLYVAVWIADDGEEADGNPLRDSNDVLIVHAVAFGLNGGKRQVDATLMREGEPESTSAGPSSSAAAAAVQRTEVRVMSWRAR